MFFQYTMKGNNAQVRKSFNIIHAELPQGESGLLWEVFIEAQELYSVSSNMRKALALRPSKSYFSCNYIRPLKCVMFWRVGLTHHWWRQDSPYPVHTRALQCPHCAAPLTSGSPQSFLRRFGALSFY